jgi:uncharacterized membrane protein
LLLKWSVDVSLFEHPAIVHFPIVLVMLSVIVDGLGVTLRARGVTQVGFGLLVLGGLGAAASALTGPDEAARAGAVGLLHRHELYAAIVVVGCLVLIAIRLMYVNGLSGSGVYGYLALGIGVVVVLVLAGHAGGQLTYAHGLGVKAAQTGADLHSGDALQVTVAKAGSMLMLGMLVAWSVWRRRVLSDNYHAWRITGAWPTRLWALSHAG